MSSGTQANPIEVFSANDSSDSSAYEGCVATPPSGTSEDPITILSDSESELTLAPVSPLGSSKRPIILTDSDSEEEPQRKKRSPSPPSPSRPTRIRLSLAIPANTKEPPELLHHYPAAATASPEGNFVVPTIDKSARLTGLLHACPSLPVAPALLPAYEQIDHEMRLISNQRATERGAFHAWRSFAEASRGTRECMVVSGLDPEDLWDEADGIENGLPAWKQAYTSEWAWRGFEPLERRTPDLSREPSVFRQVKVKDEEEDDWVVVGREREAEVVEDEEDEEEVVILKVDGGDEGYEGDVEY